MPFMNSNPNIKYGAASPGPGWVYAGKAVSPNYKMQGGLVSSWKKAPAPPAPPPPAAAPAPPPPPPPAATYTPMPLPAAVAPPPPPGPTMTDMASQFANQIATMQAGLQNSLSQQAAQFAQMQQQQTEKMNALQEQLLQAQIKAIDEPDVIGVKTADSSAGTPMQISRRGAKGTFGRSGMRIKSLNV